MSAGNFVRQFAAAPPMSCVVVTDPSQGILLMCKKK